MGRAIDFHVGIDAATAGYGYAFSSADRISLSGSIWVSPIWFDMRLAVWPLTDPWRRMFGRRRWPMPAAFMTVSRCSLRPARRQARLRRAWHIRFLLRFGQKCFQYCTSNDFVYYISTEYASPETTTDLPALIDESDIISAASGEAGCVLPAFEAEGE